MTSKKLTLLQLLDLIDLEAYRGIINKKGLVAHVKKGVLPKVINDIRGAVRLTVEREGNRFTVIQHPTALARETVGQVR